LRSYIFTERERELISKWMETGEETQQTKNILSWIRKRWLMLAEDVELWMQTIKAMQRKQVWRSYITRHSEFGSALRRAESALTRLRGDAGTSDA